MPIYEFKCTSCCGTVEHFYWPTQQAPDQVSCPQCGSPANRQVPLACVRPDYNDPKYFGNPHYADARRKQAGVGDD